MSFLIILFLALVAVMPALVWLLFFLREDVHPEPKKMISYAFFIGAIATIPALVIQLLFKNIAGESNVFFSFLVLAFIEEFFKFLAAYYAINKNPCFDEPVDAMIYMIAVASGFATVENILITFSSLETINFLNLTNTAQVLLLRFVGATLLHVLTSSIVGYAWAKSIAKKTHYGVLIQGIILATFVHTIFNHLIATFNGNNLLYSSIILIAAAFFVLNDFEILKTKTFSTSKNN